MGGRRSGRIGGVSIEVQCSCQARHERARSLMFVVPKVLVEAMRQTGPTYE